jgi:glycolate oxidase FAD binding subunit
MQQSTFMPTSEAELESIVRDAIAAKAPLEVKGCGTKESLGRPVQAAATVSLGGFSGIASYEPEELVLTAGAGTPRSEVEPILTERGQCFAFEPADYSRLLGAGHGGTLGGMIACNLAGPRRIKAGAARDHFLGFTGVSGRGETFQAGGKVVKNVTGYDLPKLLAGSYGTLAALTSVTLKVLPAPESEDTLILDGLDDASAIRAMSLALQSPFEVSGAAHLPAAISGGIATTLLRLEGIPPSVVYRREKVAALLAEFGICRSHPADESRKRWIAVRDVHPFVDDQSRIIWRLSVPPMEGARIIAAIAAQSDAQWFYDWGGGLIWLSLPKSDDGGAQLIRAAVNPGHATLIRAPQDIRAAVAVFTPQPTALEELSRRVKAGFDPTGILNPGRMYQGW